MYTCVCVCKPNAFYTLRRPLALATNIIIRHLFLFTCTHTRAPRTHCRRDQCASSVCALRMYIVCVMCIGTYTHSHTQVYRWPFPWAMDQKTNDGVCVCVCVICKYALRRNRWYRNLCHCSADFIIIVIIFIIIIIRYHYHCLL